MAAYFDTAEQASAAARDYSKSSNGKTFAVQIGAQKFAAMSAGEYQDATKGVTIAIYTAGHSVG